MSTPFEALMTYNGDGTYSYNYTLSVIGKVSIWVILRNTGIVYGDFYPNYSLTGSPDVSNISTTIDYNWGSGVVVSGLSDLVSATFNSYLRPNVTDTYTIYWSMDNGADVYINGVAIISKFGTGYYGEISTTYSFVANTNYKLFVKWQENTGGASIKLSWDYTGVSKIIIPYPNYVWPQFVGSSPFTFTISWPTGYSSTILNYPNQWYPFWGDGKRVGVEVCDDGNTKNGDGWKDDWLQIEYNCNCIGGSISSKDTCSWIVEQTPTTVSRILISNQCLDSKEILIIIIISSTLCK